MAVQLRPYAPADFDKLYALDHLCFPPGIAYSRRMLAYFLRMPQGRCTVAEHNGEIAGFIITEEDPPRGLGIGTQLLTRGEQELASSGVTEIVLESSVENAPGVAFWQRHGFRTGGTLKRYYLGRIDAYEMRKNITAAQ
jgi:[ribosomal protein S18]-alanine N-acetyltransferase